MSRLDAPHRLTQGLPLGSDSSGPALSQSALCVWAKSQNNPDERHHSIGWLPLYQHLDDTAAVAGRLWDDWASEAVKRLLAAPFGGDQGRARTLYVWLTALHDVGKISPSFSVQVPDLADMMRRNGLDIDPALYGSDERRAARHELVSHIALIDWLTEKHKFSPRRAVSYASVLAAHHGLPANALQVTGARHPRLIGQGHWQTVREEYLARAERLHTTPEDFALWCDTRLPQHTQVLLSALVIMADWIASDDRLFPYCPLNERPTTTTEKRLDAAWRQLDLPKPWRPDLPAKDIEAHFEQRFNLPPGASVRPVQSELVRLAHEIPEPSLMILEAEMGVGKTEAAMAAAEVLASRFKLSGVFIGLPTQATADGMFERAMKWASRLDLETPLNVFLARGKSQLNETFADLTREARFRAIGEQDAASHRRGKHDELVVAHHWFSSPKRGPLSHFVIGTIDQALFAGLRSRHLMLRHLALAGKVVIIDEVHAYSAYMSTYLDRVIYWLAAYDVPVIMLSATLPSARRKELIAAYDRGREAASAVKVKRSRDERRRLMERYDLLDGDIGYPTITVSGGSASPRITTPATTGVGRLIKLENIDDSLETLTHRLSSALREGGCAVIIRNTVHRVQETARFLRAELNGADIEVFVAHSRFLASDRVAKDQKLLDFFGPPSRGQARPRKFIVVASQVVEQSLDIDFDLMVSDLAPVDLLLQRAGRLHRHQRGEGESDRPAPLRSPCMLITGVDWETTPPTPAKGSQAIYQPQMLYRTLAVLDGMNEIHLPVDIPALVQSVYGHEPVGPPAWAEALSQAATEYREHLAEKKKAAGDYLLGEIPPDEESLIGWVNAHSDDPSGSQGRATVRDGDDALEVIALHRDEHGVLRTPQWLLRNGGVEIPINEAPPRWLAATILGCAIRLPASMCHYREIDRHIETLEREFDLPAWHTSYDLKGELVLVLDSTGTARLNEYSIRYDNDNGLEVTRDE